ncbi:MAG: sigma-70 family RNA polymerase sigma factor, partial [Armatimonadetes bacterium]|nr:sigma-70 family RNA polymerase sigma factor [Armatimonadota bacterium]
VARYQRPLVNFAYRYLGHRDDAEDAAQEAFVRVYLALRRLRRLGSFSTYLFATALNVCRRRAKARQQPITPPTGLAIERGPEAALERKTDLGRLLVAISALPEEYRSVVSLRIEDELSYAEIGRIVGAEEGTCRVRFHRAKEMLQAALVGPASPSEGRP